MELPEIGKVPESAVELLLDRVSKIVTWSILLLDSYLLDPQTVYVIQVMYFLTQTCTLIYLVHY